MSDPIEEELKRMLQRHVDSGGGLDGVDPPDAEQAAAGTWKGDAPQPDPLDLPEGPRPGSVPAKVGAAVMGAAPKPKLDLSQPLGYRPPKDTQLEALQGDAKQRRGEAALGQSVADFTERPTNFLDYAQKLGGGGASAAAPKTQMWKEHAAEGEQNIADLKERRAADGAMASTAEDSDPASPTAQTYRSVLVKFAPDLEEKLKGANAKQMRAMAPWLEKFHAENGDTIRANAAAEAKAIQQVKTDAEKAAALLLAKNNRAEDVADRRANTAATQSLAAAHFGIKKDEVGKKAEADINDDVQKLGKELPGDVADFGAKYERIKAAIAANPNDVPGVGAYDAHKPAFMSSRADLDIQKDAGQMLAAYQKLITGAGASDAERANLAKISLDLGNEQGFAAGLESLKQAYDAKVRDVRARFRPEVVQRLEQGQAREGAGKVTVSNGTETLQIDAADLAEAEKDGFKAVR